MAANGLAAPEPGCFPGGTCSVTANVTNPPANGPLQIVSVNDPGGLFTFDQGSCPASDLALNTTPFSPPIELPTGTTATAITCPDVVSLSANADTGCQGAVFQKNIRVVAQTP